MVTREEMIDEGRIYHVYREGAPDSILVEGTRSYCMSYIKNEFGMKAYRNGSIRLGRVIWEADSMKQTERRAIVESNLGPLRKTCRWILEHDERDLEIDFVGGGLWRMTLPNGGGTRCTSYAQAGSLILVANEVYGMTEKDAGDEWFTPQGDHKNYIPKPFRNIDRSKFVPKTFDLAFVNWARWERIGEMDWLDETIEALTFDEDEDNW